MSKKTLVTPEVSNPEVRAAVTKWVNDRFGPTPAYDESLQETIDKWGLPWFRVGAVVHNSEGKILMMHEGRVKVKKIKDAVLRDFYLNVKQLEPSDWVDGDGGWNITAGRLRSEDSFESALIREVKEESGWDVEIGDCIYIRYGDDPKDPFIMPVYLCKAISGPDHYQTIATRETIGIDWFSIEGIHAINQIGALRSPKSVMGGLKAYENYLETIRGKKGLCVTQ